MKVEFDGEKDRANRRKHGISLAAAAEMDFLLAQIAPDDRRDYGEARFRACSWIGGRLHAGVHPARRGRAGHLAAQGQHAGKETP